MSVGRFSGKPSSVVHAGEDAELFNYPSYPAPLFAVSTPKRPRYFMVRRLQQPHATGAEAEFG